MEKQVTTDDILTKLATISPFFAQELHVYQNHKRKKAEIEKMFRNLGSLSAASVIEAKDLFVGNIFIKDFVVFEVLGMSLLKSSVKLELKTLSGKFKHLFLCFPKDEKLTLIR